MAERRRSWPHRVFIMVERVLLSMGMTVLAVVVERVLVRAIKKGSVEPAPRTAADGESAATPANAPAAQVSTTLSGSS